MKKEQLSMEQKSKVAVNEAKGSILEKIGEIIREYRTKMEYTQEQLVGDINKNNIITKEYDAMHKDSSKDVGVICEAKYSVNALSRHENGDAEMGIITFINICLALHKRPDELLEHLFSDIKSNLPEIVRLYDLLDDAGKKEAIDYLEFLYYKQNERSKLFNKYHKTAI